MVANIGVRETLMLSGTIQPYSQRQTVLRTNDGDFLILGQEIHRLGLWRMQHSGLLWGQKATAQADQSFQSTQPKPALPKPEVDELKRRIVDIQISLMSEVRKDRKQIAALAQALALIESRLDVLDPPNIMTLEEDSQARQSRQGETWESDAVEFLDAIS
ncbi:MAG: hypothetical protein RM368_33485 [Nostoc sp. DedSLP03]|uniref:hypothetical protein n=1 Tax=Nostoc sp. DedSLP03 TaxID=3075400 RepID=UPI002AD2907A|nr:hypothetical protein [Nostoc sp. DedSLP03]MDZ7969799.1 hypothetical protein [Nostoc sp. DedSLP03]